MASSPLPCPLTHRLINGGREGERPRPALKTKEELLVGKTGEAGLGGSGGHVVDLPGKGQGLPERTE